MTIGVVQHDAGTTTNDHDLTVAWPGARTDGNDLLLIAECSGTFPNDKHVDLPSGWTALYDVATNDMHVLVARRAATGSGASVTVEIDDSTAATDVTAQRIILTILEINGVYEDIATDRTTGGTSKSIPSLTPDADIEALLIACGIKGNAHGINTYPSGYTLLDEEVANTGASERLSTHYKHVDTTSGSYSATIVYAGAADRWAGIHLWYSSLAPPIVADFEGDPLTGTEPLTVAFTDLSTGGTATAWDWDFGDGGTSTSQDPDHTYDAAGVYTVVLVVTIDGDDYTVTKSAYIVVETVSGYVPPLPGAATVEIWANTPGGPKWGIAQWGVATWGTAGWQDVTPQSIGATIKWGSSSPEYGILSRPNPDSWAITFHDPERILDPANPSSPFFGNVKPFLPIRVNHNGLTLRTGLVESIGHGYVVRNFDQGYARVMDNIGRLAQSKVDDDVELSDTLFARARDVISNVGLPVTVLPDPPGGDPALIAWATGTRQWSAWEWIMDAAREVLWVPYTDRHGQLGFRDYRNPLQRARQIDETELVGLQSLSQYSGLYSVVTVTDSGGTPLTRELTPKPDYGARVYERTEKTPDASDWAEAVLADRAFPNIRWIPGELYPVTAERSEALGTIEAVELIGLDHAATEPPVLTSVIVLGGTIRVQARRGESARWWFTFETAETPLEPLTVDGSSPPEYLYAENGDEYLYPG